MSVDWTIFPETSSPLTLWKLHYSFRENDKELDIQAACP